MFGSTIDYWLLRPLTHARHAKTEHDLNCGAGVDSPIDIDVEIGRLRKLQERLSGRLPIAAHLRYLDIGCGEGGMALALASLGAQSVTGVDFARRWITAATANAQRLSMDGRVDFQCQDIHTWSPPHAYDVVLSHEALEHIHDPEQFLVRIGALLEPDGVAVLAFGPLFFSPFGDHMEGFFRVPVPWRGAIFSEQAVLRLRRERFRPTDPAARYQDIAGGLNLLRYSEFLRYVRGAGLKLEFLDVNPQLRRVPALYWLSCALTRVPIVRDYVAGSVYAILRRLDASPGIRGKPL
jgi:SAM-dependent methyltransferase